MPPSVVVFGGTGFVGSRVMEKLSERGVVSRAVSRGGKQPWHLTKKHSGDLPGTEWVKCDAQNIDPALLEGADCVITLIGSPPIPSLTKSVYEHQLLMNGQTNVNVINAAKAANVKRVVLLSASIPYPLQMEGYGYFQGKKMARQHLEAFTAEMQDRQGVVLKPGMIYGTRHTDSIGIPLTPFMKPLSCIHSLVKKNVCSSVTAIDAPVDMEQVAEVIVHYACEADLCPGYRELENDALIEFKAKDI